MINLKVVHWFEVPGRGTISMVDLSKNDMVRVGDDVGLDGKVYTVRAIEYARRGLDSAIDMRDVGLIVTPKV